MSSSLVVNGVRREVAADPATPLLWVLRGDVGDQSPKYGCGAEQCGACRVLVGGRPAFSCTLPLGDVGDRPVTTAAGLADDPAGAAVQRALVAHNAGQCGYCLPGIVVTLTAVVRQGEVDDAADAGEVIDPDGLVNQLEGGFVQAASWTLKEEVALSVGDPDADPTRRPGDWEDYPILRFGETPEVTTRLLDRPDRRVLGAGEVSTGPTAAIANAVFQATGARLRDLPLRPARVKAALQALL